MIFGKLDDLGLLKDDRLFRSCPWPVWRSKGTVPCNDDVVVLAEIQQLLLVEVGVALDLVNSWLYLKCEISGKRQSFCHNSAPLKETYKRVMTQQIAACC